jgi:hypothetical protein
MHTLLYYFGIIIFRPSQFTAFFNARDSPLTLSTPAIVVSFLLYGLIIIIAGFAAAAAASAGISVRVDVMDNQGEMSKTCEREV